LPQKNGYRLDDIFEPVLKVGLHEQWNCVAWHEATPIRKFSFVVARHEATPIRKFSFVVARHEATPIRKFSFVVAQHEATPIRKFSFVVAPLARYFSD
jgi:phage terminase large subunit-like protein